MSNIGFRMLTVPNEGNGKYRQAGFLLDKNEQNQTPSVH
jgi:hypothetical protein